MTPASRTTSDELDRLGELRYGAVGGRRPIDLRLRLRLDGSAELYLGSSWSLPGRSVDTVGRFGGPDLVDPERVRELAGSIAADASAGGMATQPFDAIPRVARLVFDGDSRRIDLAGPIGPAEQGLLEIAGGLLDKPLAAIRGRLDRSTSAVELVNVGFEPASLILVDPEPTAAGLFVRWPGDADPSESAGSWPTDRTVLDRAVAEGRLPPGRVDLSPGGRLVVGIPAAATEDASSVALSFAWPGEGPERRLVTLLARPIGGG
ncbi:MAG TPA: hypothetical protein VFO78_02980 [Candidatus Limnocylindrales bacterium]|nr:hypothetical protein [Candidatus Limnocylindrales bacterium]